MRGELQSNRIDGRDVARLVQRLAGPARLDGDFAAHSLRTGFVTSEAERGIAEVSLQIVTGHRSATTLRGYVRPATLSATRRYRELWATPTFWTGFWDLSPRCLGKRRKGAVSMSKRFSVGVLRPGSRLRDFKAIGLATILAPLLLNSLLSCRQPAVNQAPRGHKIVAFRPGDRAPELPATFASSKTGVVAIKHFWEYARSVFRKAPYNHVAPLFGCKHFRSVNERSLNTSPGHSQLSP